MSDDLITLLRALAAAQHSDLTVAADAADRIERLTRERDEARAEVERLREALSWYSDQRNHFPAERRNPGDPDPAVVFMEAPSIMSDGGQRARDALEAKP